MMTTQKLPKQEFESGVWALVEHHRETSDLPTLAKLLREVASALEHSEDYESLKKVKVPIIPPGKLSLEEAKEKRCCRICAEPGSLRQGHCLILDYGREFAHSDCMEKALPSFGSPCAGNLSSHHQIVINGRARRGTSCGLCGAFKYDPSLWTQQEQAG